MDFCFEDREKITLEEFKEITEKKSSDMLMSILSLFREKLPCS
jgi:hypothetical protein